MANISKIKLPSGVTYDVVDEKSGYITSASLPTKTSDLTNDSGFITSYTDEKLKVTSISNSTEYTLVTMPSSGSVPRTVIGNLCHEFKIKTDGSTYSALYVGDSYRGQIRLGNKANSSITYTTLKTSHTTDRTITLPNKDGTVALTSDIPTVPTITLNGTSTTSASFYAPIAVGTSGQFLKSNGSGAPTWVNLPTVSSTAAGIVPMSETSSQPKILCATTNGYVYWESFEVWDSTVQDQVGNYTQDEEGVYLAIQEATTTEPGLMSAADKTAIAAIPTNWLNGSATGSVRTSGSTVEDSNYTIGNYAVAEGHDTEASGNCSHAAGLHTIAQRTSQTVIGQYNILDTSEYSMGKGDYLFIIGNGTADARSNALAVKWDGTVETAKGNLSGVQIVRW